MSDQGILSRLRAATHDAHVSLENRVRIDQRVADVAAYAELLEKFLGWYGPMELRLRSLTGWERQGIDLERREKTGWLARDLEALGRDQARLFALPCCDRLPPVNTLSQGFGCAYVMEGATLGGRQISGMLRGSPIPENARTFFESYGPAVGDMWKEFIGALEAFAREGGNGDEIVQAARESFASLEAWVSPEQSRGCLP